MTILSYTLPRCSAQARPELGADVQELAVLELPKGQEMTCLLGCKTFTGISLLERAGSLARMSAQMVDKLLTGDHE